MRSCSVSETWPRRKFFGEGFGCPSTRITRTSCRSAWARDRRRWLSTNTEAAAQDAGVAPAEPGESGRPAFRGVSLHYIVASSDIVDEVMRQAEAAGGSIVRDAAAAQWGGCFGYFSDPDGHLWKVASSSR